MSPDGAGPMRVPCRSLTPSGSCSNSNHQVPVGLSGSVTAQPNARSGSYLFTNETVSHSPIAGW